MTEPTRPATSGRPVPPHDVRTLAHERREARLARRWEEADRLKEAIEAAGWRVVDRGVDFALRPGTPPDREVDGLLLYGAAANVPSLLESEPLAGIALLALGEFALDPGVIAAAGTGIASHLVRAVAGATPDPATAASPAPPAALETVRLDGDPTAGSLLAAALHRAPTETVVIAWRAIDPAAVAALAAALDAPEIAVAGLAGATSADLRHLTPVASGEADLLLATAIAARRETIAAILPVDERLVAPDRLAAWLSLALRQGPDPERAPGRAVVVPGVIPPDGVDALVRDAEGDRSSRKDFYRILDRFGLDPALLRGGAG